MVLNLYFARRFLWSVTKVFLIFLGILLLIDMIEQLRRFSGFGVGLAGAGRLALLNVPETMYRILPLILIMGAIANFMALARSSELVVVRAAGRSGLRFLLTPILVALALGLVAVTLFNPLVAATSKRYEAETLQLSQGKGSVISVSDSGLWLRQGGDTQQTVVKAAKSGPDGTELFDVTFLSFGLDGQPLQRILAATAQLGPDGWTLTDLKTWDLTDPNPELTAIASAGPEVLASDLTPQRIRDGFGSPSDIALWNLPGFIKDLERAGFSSVGYQLWFQMELAQPLLLVAMVLIAAGFTMRHVRFGGTGRMVLFAMFAGFGIFFLRNFAQAMGDTGQIPIALAAWSPPIIALFLSLGFLLHLEDG